jgi:hypothetical protein
MFAWSTLEDARAFRAGWRWDRPTVVYAVEGTCRQRVNMPLLKHPGVTGITAFMAARDYWAGRRGDAAELWECLRDLPVTIGDAVE